MSELGTKIKTLRNQAGLTQKQLAEQVGLERTSITNIEAGNQKLHVDSLTAIAAALGYRMVFKFEKLGVPTLRSEEWR